MTLVLWGSIISIVGALIGGTIVAIGKYRQDIASSKKSDTILFNTEEGLGISRITKEGVKELIEQKNKLDIQVKELLTKQEELKHGQDTLSHKLEPFINYAQKKFPNVSSDEALIRLEELLNRQTERLDKTDEKVDKIEKDVSTEKDKTKPQLTLKSWTVKNEKVTSVPKRPVGLKDFFDAKEKFNLDYVIFNQIEFEYKTEVNRSEYTFLLNKNDAVYSLISIKGGLINTQQIKSPDGKMGFKLKQPQNGVYVLKIYSKTHLNSLEKFIISI